MKSLTSKPATFLWRSPGVNEPGATYSTANLGAIITATGGTNIADSLLSGEEGTLTLEKIIESNPKNIIATGASGRSRRSTKKPRPVTSTSDTRPMRPPPRPVWSS